MVQQDVAQDVYDANMVEDTYQILESAVDTAYEASAADVERFLRHHEAGPFSQNVYGRVDVEIKDEHPIVWYRTVHRAPAPEGEREIPVRQVPLGDNEWDDHLQDVYAPLAAACSQTEQLLEQDILSQEEQETIADIGRQLTERTVTPETASTVYDQINKYAATEDGERISSHVIYMKNE